MLHQTKAWSAALGSLLALLYTTAALAAPTPCVPFSIDDHINNLLIDGKAVGGEGPVRVKLNGQLMNAFITIIRLGPTDAIKRPVLNFLTLDFGAQGSIAASLPGDQDATGLFEQPPRTATFEGNGTVISGTQQFVDTKGVFYTLLQNDFVRPIAVQINGMLCQRAAAG
jgi:hypothetical protein